MQTVCRQRAPATPAKANQECRHGLTSTEINPSAASFLCCCWDVKMSSASDKNDATAASRLISSAAAPSVDFFLFFGDLLCGRQAVDTSCFLSPRKSEAAGFGIQKHFRLKHNSTTEAGRLGPSLKIKPAVLELCSVLCCWQWRRKNSTKWLEMVNKRPENWAHLRPSLSAASQVQSLQR